MSNSTVTMVKQAPYHTPRAGHAPEEADEDDSSDLAPVQAPKASNGNKYDANCFKRTRPPYCVFFNINIFYRGVLVCFFVCFVNVNE